MRAGHCKTDHSEAREFAALLDGAAEAQQRKVLFVCNTFWIGGPITWLWRLCEHLPQHDWTCKLVLPGTIRPRPEHWNRWPCPVDLLKPVYSGPVLVRSLSNAIRLFNPDVVVNVALDATPNAIRLLRRARGPAVKYIDTLHSDSAPECDRLRPHADIVDAVAVCGEGCDRRVRTQIPELGERVVQFWCPVPCDEEIDHARYASGPLRLVSLARLCQYPKRVLDLVPLCRRLADANIDFSLTVIGDGPDRAAVEAGIRSNPAIGDRVQFLGWLPNSVALEVLRRQHVILLLSEFEGQPIALLEAMGCGVAPVVTDIPAHREVIVAGESGFMLPVGDMSQFAATLAGLAANRTRLAALGDAALRKVRSTWHPAVAIPRFVDLLEEVASRPVPCHGNVGPVSYPASRMTQLGIPQAVQGMKRWLLRQDVIY